MKFILLLLTITLTLSSCYKTNDNNKLVFSKAKVEYSPSIFIIVNDTIAIRKIDSTVFILSSDKSFYSIAQ